MTLAERHQGAYGIAGNASRAERMRVTLYRREVSA